MVTKKYKLSAESDTEIDIIGITTGLNDYRLAYFLNKVASFNLQRLNDLPVFNEKLKVLRDYSLFTWTDDDHRLMYYLISNDHNDGKMIEQYSQANYFLFIKGKHKAQDSKSLQSLIRKIPSVTFVFVPEILKIKELSGILQDLELHELNKT
ncbi:MAG TPA: IPExxxVDY family protein [Lentimicrobium sp.]|nr:IPExxxVDY family protein [Lentimicrobium sp.]